MTFYEILVEEQLILRSAPDINNRKTSNAVDSYASFI